MTLRDYLRILRKRWLLVLACTLAATGAALGATMLATPIYQANVQLFVSARGQAGDISSSYTGTLFTQQRVKSYADVISSPLVTTPVIKQLGLDLTPAALGNQVHATVPLDTTLLNVSVNDPSPARARDIASAVATQFIRLVPQVEASDAANSPVVKVTVITPATEPTAPVSPRPKVNLALGVLLGLAIGVGAAVLREVLDTTVKSLDDVQHLTGAVPLGLIADDPGVTRRPLVSYGDGTSPRSEAFRQLRTNLQFVDVDRPPRSVVVSSSVADEGKSMTSANLAITLAQAGRDVVLVEADLRRPKVADYMKLEGGAGLTNVLAGQLDLADALQPWGRDRLRVLPSGPLPPNPSEMLGSRQMHDLLRRLLDLTDIVIFDAPPLLPVTDAAVLARLADGVIMVARHGRTRKEQLARAVDNLEAVNARLLGTVLNMVPTKGPDAGYYASYSHYHYYRQGGRQRLDSDASRSAVHVRRVPRGETQAPTAPNA